MNLLPSFLHIIVKKVQAVTVDPELGGTMCYMGTADLESTATGIVQWILGLIAPLSALVIAIVNARKLLKRKEFSLQYAVYKTFRIVFVLLVIFFVAFGALQYLVTKASIVTADGYSESVFSDVLQYLPGTLGIVTLLIFIPTAVVYLCCAFRNKTFLKLGLSYFFIIPAVVIFLMVIIKNRTPSMRATLPTDAIINKKQDLQQQLHDQGKLPPDSQLKP